MRNVLEWSLETSTHIETISVYAFSIDNFKRHEGEIDLLMRLCAQELPNLARSEGVKKSKSENRRQRKTGLSAERSERGVRRSDGKDERERGESGVERVFGV